LKSISNTAAIPPNVSTNGRGLSAAAPDVIFAPQHTHGTEATAALNTSNPFAWRACSIRCPNITIIIFSDESPEGERREVTEKGGKETQHS